MSRYISDRKRYGKTIIFADRWYQCEYLREALQHRDVRAGAVYSFVAIDRGGADVRNRRTASEAASENAKALLDFKEGRLDVLINVRMLTEGTDVPNVQTVFLTRQTTSRILLTQMVGRGLRGQAFGGTENAYIVSFIDDWTHRIDWAAYDPLNPGEADDTARDYGKPPTHPTGFHRTGTPPGRPDGFRRQHESRTVQHVPPRRVVSRRVFGRAIGRGASRAGSAVGHGL